MQGQAQQKPMSEAQSPSGKKIMFLHAAGKLGGVRGEILGVSQSLGQDETITLVADGLIARFEAKQGVSERIKDLAPGAVFEVAPGRPRELTANVPIPRFGQLIAGEDAVFHIDLIPLMDRYCSCCF
jgi:hypothetical protein